MLFPVEIIEIIVGYAPAYKIHPYINRLLRCNRFDIADMIKCLCANPCDAAIDIIRNNKSYMRYIDWNSLSRNPCDAAVDLLFEYKENISSYWIRFNINKRIAGCCINDPEWVDYKLYGYLVHMREFPSDEHVNLLIDVIKNGIIKIHYGYSISMINSDKLIRFISEYKGGRYLDYNGLCINGCDAAVDILYSNIDSDIKDGIVSTRLNMNPNDRIVNYLFEHKQYINDVYFIKNSNPRVIKYYSDKITYYNYHHFMDNKGGEIYNVLEDMANRGVMCKWYKFQIYHLARPNIFTAKKNNVLYNVLHSM